MKTRKPSFEVIWPANQDKEHVGQWLSCHSLVSMLWHRMSLTPATKAADGNYDYLQCHYTLEVQLP